MSFAEPWCKPVAPYCDTVRVSNNWLRPLREVLINVGGKLRFRIIWFMQESDLGNCDVCKFGHMSSKRNYYYQFSKEAYRNFILQSPGHRMTKEIFGDLLKLAWNKPITEFRNMVSTDTNLPCRQMMASIMSSRQQWMPVIMFVLQKILLTSLHCRPLLRPLETCHLPKWLRLQVIALCGKEERNSQSL
jgi:hypothetical protein